MVVGDPTVSERPYRFTLKAPPIDAARGALSGRLGEPCFVGSARVKVIAVDNNRIARDGKLLRQGRFAGAASTVKGYNKRGSALDRMALDCCKQLFHRLIHCCLTAPKFPRRFCYHR